MSIALTNLTKRFGENLVVNNVSININDGELLVLLGSSGSGKSTILRMIAGLVQPDSGHIELHGRDVTFLSPQARNIGFVFQNYSVFRHMTIQQNVAFGLQIRKHEKKEQQKRVDELLDLVGLTGFGERYPQQLSGGQLQRVALARALAYHPAVLLLDEPFGALDVKIRAQLRQSLKDIQRQLKVTTILVTHDQDEAFELADRIGVIENGSLIELGHPEEIYHHPKTDYAAAFVGNGNVLVGQREGNQIRLGSIMLPFPKNAPRHDEGAPVHILFRPESIRISKEPFPFDSDTYVLGYGEVVDSIFSGSQQKVTLKIGGLQGSRSVAPDLPFGKRTSRIQALLPSIKANNPYQPGECFWAGLEQYHVLQPRGFRALICVDPSSKSYPPSRFCRTLLNNNNDQATLITVVGKDKLVAQAQTFLDELRRSHYFNLPNLRTRVRKGSTLEEIVVELQEGQYDMIIFSRNEPFSGSLSWNVLCDAQIPVLIIPPDREEMRRVLICTAGGEPGKADIRFGGRIARRAHASATLFNVRRKESGDEELERIERHLRSGQALLDALGVPGNYRIEKHKPLTQAILSEAQAGDYGLVIMGAPPRQPHHNNWPKPVIEIIAETECPVLIVPMVE